MEPQLVHNPPGRMPGFHGQAKVTSHLFCRVDLFQGKTKLYVCMHVCMHVCMYMYVYVCV